MDSGIGRPSSNFASWKESPTPGGTYSIPRGGPLVDHPRNENKDPHESSQVKSTQHVSCVPKVGLGCMQDGVLSWCGVGRAPVSPVALP